MKLVPDLSARRGAAVLAMALALAGCVGATATPTPAASSTATSTPAATPTPAPTATIAATPTATEAVTPTPAASPTSAAAACTGSAANQAWFVEAATKLPFDVYCAVLPSGWWLQSASYVLSSGGFLEAEYKNAGGAGFHLWEGAWCPPEKACIAHGPQVATASFGGLAGTLHLNTGAYTLEVGTWAHPAYLMAGSGMTQAQFVAWAAALHKVPKP
jgi:hypothetical protein